MVPSRRRRVLIIVLDSVGIGALPDAAVWGDAGANTLGHIARAVGGLSLPNLQRLGLGNLGEFEGISATDSPAGRVTRLAERSVGKDTTTGHWELMGLPVDRPFPVYPDGFPPEVMDRASQVTGYQFIGNRPASGTQIIDELGEQHLASGALIAYTSADSVFQVAAHEEAVSVEELYRVCHLIRDEVLTGEHAVARVIARPFTGQVGSFERTPRRHDYSVAPFGPTALDTLTALGVPTYGIGKIADIFAGAGVQQTISTVSNEAGMDALIELAGRIDCGLVFVNLVDFDMVWGHRRDVDGYAAGLAAFDQRLSDLLPLLSGDDLLLITADHGCDPTYAGSDHTREYVPLIAWSPSMDGATLGDEPTFATVAASVLDWFRVTPVDTALAGLRYGWTGRSVVGKRVGTVPRGRNIAIDDAVIDTVEALLTCVQSGERLYLVGGPVRDHLAGAQTGDVDLAYTGDVADFMMGALPDGYTVSLSSEQLRTIKVFRGGVEVGDVASTRAESYRPDSAYPASVPAPIEWDLARRDFTVNALAVPMHAQGGAEAVRDFRISDVVDPHGGIGDIESGTIRILHDNSFSDDPTRLFRAVRFSRRFGWAFDARTAEVAIKAVESGSLNKLTLQQRAREEQALALLPICPSAT